MFILAAAFLGSEIRERGWGFFRRSDYGVSSDVWRKKGGAWELVVGPVGREYFWMTGRYMVFIDNKADNLLFPVAYPDPLRCDIIPMSIRPPQQPIIDSLLLLTPAGRRILHPLQAKHWPFRDTKIPSHPPQTHNPESPHTVIHQLFLPPFSIHFFFLPSVLATLLIVLFLTAYRGYRLPYNSRATTAHK